VGLDMKPHESNKNMNKTRVKKEEIQRVIKNQIKKEKAVKCKVKKAKHV
jgi:hypothetical protein